jgi:N6-L-threonylcarbamoyladenine synthase
MKILGIETSCDETALSLIDATGDISSPKFKVLNTALYSQIEKHREFGGVFPALAKREHAKNLVPLLSDMIKDKEGEEINEPNWKEVEEILEREPELFEQFKKFISENKKPDVDYITVTYGPGLEPALWVGINFAKALSLAWNIPVIPTNHMEGHIASVLTESEVKDFPVIALLISGGHTELVKITNWGEYEYLGGTRDDAVGEAYDKVARMLDLPYPGGPEISKLAKEAREENLSDDEIEFPRPMLNTDDYDFSLSGLKTSVLYKVKEVGELNDENKKIIAKEFEESIKDVLIKKTQKAIFDTGAKSLIVGGGVIANEYLKENLKNMADSENINSYFPTKELSTDNAVMIAVAGYLKKDREEFNINPNIIANGNLKLS